MKKTFQKIIDKKGAIITIESMFWVLIAFGLLIGALEVSRHLARIQDTKAIAQNVARQVALKGAADEFIDNYIDELKEIYNMDIDVEVDGNFIPGTRHLQLETPFVVTVRYTTFFKIGIVRLSDEVIYEARAVGTSEQYY